MRTAINEITILVTDELDEGEGDKETVAYAVRKESWLLSSSRKHLTVWPRNLRHHGWGSMTRTLNVECWVDAQ